MSFAVTVRAVRSGTRSTVCRRGVRSSAGSARRGRAAGVEPYQALDHGTHLAVYVTDPDGNDVELAWDRAPQQWPPYDSSEFFDAPLDVDALIAHA